MNLSQIPPFLGSWRGLLSLLLLACLLPLGCNVAEVEKSGKINVKVSPSLSSDSGKYDIIQVDILFADGTPYLAPAFKGEWKDDGDHKIKNIDLGQNAPNPYTIKITAYKNGVIKLQYTVAVNNGSVEKTLVLVADTALVFVPPIIDTTKVDTTKPPIIDTTNPPVIDTLPKVIPPASVVIDTKGPLVLAVGGSPVVLAARVLPDSANPTLEWLSDDPTIAEIVNGNSVKPKAVGITTLIARSKEDPSKLKTLAVEVQAAPILPTRVTITNARPVKISIGGSTLALDGKVEPLGASQELTWTSSDTALASVSVNQLKGLKVGTVKVTAQSVAAPTLMDTLTVEVQLASIPPDSVVLATPSPLVLIIGNPNTELKASILPSGADQGIIWNSADVTVADLENGKFAKGLKVGETQFTATSAANATLKKLLTVRVQNPVIKPKAVTITVPNVLNLAVGGADGDLAAKIDPAEAKQEVIWESKDTSIVQITAANKAKPIKAGTTKIIARSKEDPALADTMTVEVIVPVKVEGLTISPKTLKLYTGGDSAKVAVTLLGNDPGAKYTLNSSVATVASVSTSGMVKGLKAGKTVVSATAVGYPAINDSCQVEVLTDAPVLTVTDNSPIAYNAEAVFSVSTKQDYGTIEKILVDWDGNGAFEDSVVKKDTAIFKRKFSANAAVVFEARDSEGNKTKVSRNLVVQAPGAPVVKITVPTTPTVTINKTTYAFTFTVNDPTKTGTETVDSSLTGLKEGSNLITVKRSNAGGTGTATLTVIVDTTPPGAPTFTASTTASPTRSRTPTWAWQSAGGGSGIYRYKVGTAAAVEGANLSYVGANLGDGTYTLTVAEKDAAGNWSLDASRSIQVKGSAPSAPELSVNAALSNAPRWNWQGGGGGNGTFRFKLGTAAYPSTGSTAVSHAPTNLGEGSNTLCVQEQDAIGWGAEACASITVDKTLPNLEITEPSDEAVLITSVNPVIKGTVFDNNLDAVRYTVNNGTSKTISVQSNAWTLGESYSDGDHTVRVYAKDKAGNTEVMQSIVVHKRSKVIFVRKSAGGKGTSWADAYSELSSAMNDSRTNNPGTQIWVASGTYAANSAEGFNVKNENSLYGGFSTDGKMWDLTKRNFTTYKTRLNGDGSELAKVVTIGSSDRNDPSTRANTAADGFEIGNSSTGIYGYPQSKGISLINCTFTGLDANPFYFGDGAAGPVLIQNCRATQNRGNFYIDLSGSGGGDILIDGLVTIGNNSLTNGIPTMLSLNTYNGNGPTDKKTVVQNSKILDGGPYSIELTVDPGAAEVKNTVICGGASTISDTFGYGIILSGITDRCTE